MTVRQMMKYAVIGGRQKLGEIAVADFIYIRSFMLRPHAHGKAFLLHFYVVFIH